MTSKKQYQYPWHYNNKYKVLIDGDAYFSSMLDEIRNAKEQVLLETYLFESGNIASRFIDELCTASERGVNIYLLLDEYGSKGLNDKDKQRLTSADIKLNLYNPVSFFHLGKSLKRDHRKLLIIDNHISFIGGAGIKDEFTPASSNHYWHDVMLKINGDLTEDLTHSFMNIWHEDKANLKTNNNKTNTITEVIENKARFVTSKSTEKNEILRTVIKHIRSSKKRIWLTSPYFISSWKIRRALRLAAKKGIDVRLIFPGPHSDHKWVTYGIRRYYQRLLKANVAVYEFQPRFSHAKIILCDDWYTIGSSNFDMWNQFLNLDANIEIYDQQSHQQIVNLFKSDFSNSSLVFLNKWSTRSLLQHFREWISGIVISSLAKIGKKFRR